MINGGKLIGKSSPLGDSGKLSRAASKAPNDVASKQASEGLSRNSEVYREQVPNNSQADNPIQARLSSPSSNRGAAGYEGGRSTYIEMDNTGYSQLANSGASNGSGRSMEISGSMDTSIMLPGLFGPRKSSISDYSKFRGNLNR